MPHMISKTGVHALGPGEHTMLIELLKLLIIVGCLYITMFFLFISISIILCSVCLFRLSFDQETRPCCKKAKL